jgi:aryl-alcohol dehydrogenase-like predicted oxidoreductase
MQVAGFSTANAWLRDPPTPARVSKKQINESVESSLRSLKTDYIDLLQIHWCGKQPAGDQPVWP